MTAVEAQGADLTQPEETDKLARKAWLRRQEGRARSRTLVLIRWIAILGQSSAVLVVHFALGYTLPLFWCLGAIAASAWLNIFLVIRDPGPKRLQDREAGLFLAYDILQLTVLFYLTGGVQNPFILLFLVPVTISATILNLGNTLVLGGLTVACVSALFFFHLPLPWSSADGPGLPQIYLVGMWFAVILGTIFLSVYAWRIANEARRMSDALAATQMALAREQRLSALGGLAAAAAHELGTPLGTITLVARELNRDLGESEYADDLELLVDQAKRCRDILSNFSDRPDQDDSHFSAAAFSGVVEEAARAHTMQGKVVDVKVVGERGQKREGKDPDAYQFDQPYIERHPEIVHGLGNFIENAVDFAKSRVEILLSWSDTKLYLRIVDDGPGFSPDILDRIGEPYVSTRRPEELKKKGKSAEDGHQGMGLGVFIAKSLLERTGASVSFANGADEGAVVAVSWPRDAIEAGRPTG